MAENPKDDKAIANRALRLQVAQSKLTNDSSGISTIQQNGETDLEQTNTITVKSLSDGVPNSIQEAQALIKINDTLIQNLGKV